MCHFLPNGQTPWRGHEVPVSTSRVCAHRLAPCVILSGTWHQMPLNCRSKPYVNTGKLFCSSFRIFVRCSLIPCGETFSFVKWEGVINYWGICQWGTHSSCIVSVFSIKKDTNVSLKQSVSLHLGWFYFPPAFLRLPMAVLSGSNQFYSTASPYCPHLTMCLSFTHPEGHLFVCVLKSLFRQIWDIGGSYLTPQGFLDKCGGVCVCVGLVAADFYWRSVQKRFRKKLAINFIHLIILMQMYSIT